MNYLEYQMSLYNVEVSKTEYKLIYQNSISAFLDPNKEDYSEKILLMLRNIFPKSNEKPKVYVRPNRPLARGSYHYAISDTIFLESVIDDIDSKEEDYKYFWQIDTTSDVLSKIDKVSKNQLLIDVPVGDYKINFCVFDGISYSDTFQINFHVYAKPHLSVLNNSYNIFNTGEPILQSYVTGKQQMLCFPPIDLKVTNLRYSSITDSSVLSIRMKDTTTQTIFEERRNFRDSLIRIVIGRSIMGDNIIVMPFFEGCGSYLM